MSQIISPAVSSTPAVPTSFTTDVNDTTIVPGDIPASAGSSVPQANILRVSGDNGIKTVATPNAAGNLTIRFIRDGAQTTDGTTVTPILTQTTATDTTLTVQIIVSGFSDANDSYGAYATVVINNTAGTARVVGDADFIINSDASLATAEITVTVSGADFVVNATGVAATTIDWTVALPGIVST